MIIDYSLYRDEYETTCKTKFENPIFHKMVEKYFATPKHAHQGISDPKQYSYNHTLVYFHQLQVGIRALKQYMSSKNTLFDIICKTRYDSKYPDEFYPHIPNDDNDIIKRVAFNEDNYHIIKNNMTDYRLTTIDDLIAFNKQTRLPIPYGHLPNEHAGLGLGGMVCYNYESLERIKETGTRDILYSFNQCFVFSNTHTFLKLESLLDHACIIECNNPDLYNHYFCPESQDIMTCLYLNINIIMYPECYYGTFVNR
jgi:hypothetical protein